LPVLTTDFGDWGNGGVRPAVKRRRRWRWCSTSGDLGCGEEQRRGAASVVQYIYIYIYIYIERDSGVDKKIDFLNRCSDGQSETTDAKISSKRDHFTIHMLDSEVGWITD
jgi:hypothetical protein